MDASLVGALVGLLVGVADFAVLRLAAKGQDAARASPSATGGLTAVAVLSIVVFPIVGWFAGPLVASNLGGLSL